MEQKDVRFYKLDKSERYGAEGTYFNVGEVILLISVIAAFWAVTIAMAVVNFNVLLRDVKIIVFICVFIVILSVITALAFLMYLPLIKKRKRARAIFKNSTLTDGTVISVNKQKMWHSDRHRSYSYYRILLEYIFHGLDGGLRYGQYTGNYGEIPFYVGQNLMIAFNDTDSVIVGRFTLSDGAEEFAKAEAERGQADFTGLTGDLIKVDTSKPVYLAKYFCPFSKTRQRKKRLKQILESNPRFTEGKLFLRKNTYRFKETNNKFYCYLTANGIKYVEECAGLSDFKDGAEVIVAYGGGFSEIIKNYSLKKHIK